MDSQNDGGDKVKIVIIDWCGLEVKNVFASNLQPNAAEGAPPAFGAPLSTFI